MTYSHFIFNSTLLSNIDNVNQNSTKFCIFNLPNKKIAYEHFLHSIKIFEIQSFLEWQFDYKFDKKLNFYLKPNNTLLKKTDVIGKLSTSTILIFDIC